MPGENSVDPDQLASDDDQGPHFFIGSAVAQW